MMNMDDESREIEKTDRNIMTETGDITNIVNNDQLKTILDNVLKKFDENADEAMDMYYIFKDMIANSGDFDSSQAVKEQVSNLLKVAQDANAQKLRVFETIFKSKTKSQIIEKAEINQNNNYFGMDRRSLLKAIEEMKKEEQYEQVIKKEIETEREIVVEISKPKNVGDFVIGVGDFTE